ncbi:hypothetical protein [Candidatus Colwellia aromaticivorans]|uniref:hypothetical protein n=1 Tax=Candidatus Colwellia aromaticivorans TaxID=2267621 RepID=UPI0014448EB9|nr:hypothetical protein [Candidatus Colwellia aromaticivorans]
MKNLFKSIPLVLVFCMSVTSVLSILSELPSSDPIPFANYDRDGNGLISRQEFIQVKNERIAAIVAQGLSMSDIGNSLSFVAIDEDRNGQLSENELVSGQQTQIQNRRGTRGGPSNVGQARGKGANMGKYSNMANFSEFDMNGDVVILAEEFYEAKAEKITERV